MPLYSLFCPKCDNTWEAYHRMSESHGECPLCQTPALNDIRSVQTSKPADAGWELENNGAGRYCPQLEQEPGKVTRDAHCRSRSELIEKAKRLGYEVYR